MPNLLSAKIFLILQILVFLAFPFAARASEEPAVGVTAVVEPILIQVGELKSFKADKKISEFPRFNFIAILKNIGTFPLAYEGEMTVFNMIGKQTAKLAFKSNGNLIYPDEEKEIITSWNKPFGFGFYTVFLDLIYAQGHKGSAIAQTTIWVIPWRVILFTLLAGLLLRWMYKKNV